ncbi:MAG: hypothetical protein MJ180_05400 [Candidatus Gastranaerophilales bacterium]|nr:hypothetical protein [Candidatus Gastranaerophilales bacterium]
MQSSFNRKEIIEKITPVIENAAMKNGVIPIEIDFQKESGKWFLRIYIYCNDHPVSLDDCENLTNSIDNFLNDIIPVKYYLEVSSPGLERKFKSNQEFTIFKGKKIKLKLKNPIDETNTKVFNGFIEDFQKNIGLIFKEEKTENILTIKEDNILSAQLIFDDYKGEKHD